MPYSLEDSPLRYRLSADINLRDFCGQVVKLQEIMDRNGNSIILMIGEDHQARTLAYEIKTRVQSAISHLPASDDDSSKDAR